MKRWLLNRPVEDRLFDGELLSRRLHTFLSRVDKAIGGAAEALPGHSIESIEVSVEIDAGLNLSFLGAGGSIDRTSAFTFTLKPRS